VDVVDHRHARLPQPQRREERDAVDDLADDVGVAADAGGFAIDLPQSWLDESPLSAAALGAEADHWKTVGMKFQLSGLSDKKVSVLQQVR
jgi:hypothetical protein